MILLTLQELLVYVQNYLEKRIEFSDIRNFVYQYYEAEVDYELDPELEKVCSVLLPYLHYEEAYGDRKRDLRLQRLRVLLSSAQSAFVERTVFGLEFDEIRELTKKLDAEVIGKQTYYEQVAKLSPATYDVNRVIQWAHAHRDSKEPVEKYVLTSR